jgi:hypothetical protein
MNILLHMNSADLIHTTIPRLFRPGRYPLARNKIAPGRFELPSQGFFREFLRKKTRPKPRILDRCQPCWQFLNGLPFKALDDGASKQDYFRMQLKLILWGTACPGLPLSKLFWLLPQF